MKNIIKDILIFVNSQQTPYSLNELEKELGRRALRVMAINLLTWLKGQHRSRLRWIKSKYRFRNREYPLKLNMQHDWCKNLSYWLSKSDELSKLFVISGNNFDFSSEIQEDVRNSIRAFVDSEYNPRIMT